MSLDEATMAVGCEDGSLHGMKLSQGGVGVQHAWSKPAAAAGACSVLAIDMSTDGKVGRTSYQGLIRSSCCHRIFIFVVGPDSIVAQSQLTQHPLHTLIMSKKKPRGSCVLFRVKTPLGMVCGSSIVSGVYRC